jgi:hypothetical protein
MVVDAANAALALPGPLAFEIVVPARAWVRWGRIGWRAGLEDLETAHRVDPELGETPVHRILVDDLQTGHRVDADSDQTPVYRITGITGIARLVGIVRSGVAGPGITGSRRVVGRVVARLRSSLSSCPGSCRLIPPSCAGR